jgi:ketosteroid isomerase-like protein
VVIERPYAPAALRRTEGVEVLRQGLAQAAGLYELEKVDNVVLHETTDPEVIIVEYDLHGRMVSGDRPFTLSFVMVMTIRDGRIVHTRDYSDPIAGAQALGRLPELLASLQP